MILQRAPANVYEPKEITCASSYVGHNGEKPKVGSLIAPKNVIFEGAPKEGQWRLTVADRETMEMVKNNIHVVQIYSDTIPILD
jgi:hypothetical protein